MASTSLAQTQPGFRHRIQEITLQPTPSSRPMEVELLADQVILHLLPTIEPGQVLQWDMRLLPCDVHPDSRITLKITKRNRISADRVKFAEYLVADVANQTSITINTSERTTRSFSLGSATKMSRGAGQNDNITVTLRFWGPEEIEEAYSSALSKSKMMLASEKGPLDRIGKARPVLESIIGFGEAITDINPSTKVVISLFVQAWKYIESIQQNYNDMQKLVDGLNRILPFLNSVRQRSRDVGLRDTIAALLNLIEDTSNFVIGYMSDTTVARVLRNPVSSRVTDQVDLLLRKFQDLKEDFDRGVQVEQLRHILTNEQRMLLNKLNPAPRAHYANSPPCQEGTREQVLSEIYEWLPQKDTSKRLFWLYGRAGQGKSCISSSVCQKTSQEKTLGAHFFCKRDDPELRNPGNVLNTIVHQLATHFKPYGQAVANAIEEGPHLPESPLEQRYTNFIEQPLRRLQEDRTAPSDILTVVIDALDECEKGRNRRLLLTYLREMSRLVPWLKVLVTSRPDQDIKTTFGKLDDPFVCSRDLILYDASYDIYAFTRKRMAEIAEFKSQVEWPDHTIRLLTERSGGLFIWIETACKFTENGSDVDTRLEQILEGTQPVEGSEPLDMLFTTAIEHSLGDNAQDNVRNVRNCIGAIMATADRTPLSVTGLEVLLSSYIKRGVFRNVVNELGSVLYEDKAAGDAVRVYHPSFADFMANASRSKRFYVDPQEQDTRIAECCIRTMIKELKFDICGLESSHTLNCDIPDLASRVQTSISEQLKYSCLHWASHLVGAPKGVLNELLREFLLGRQLLYWIEVLSLLSSLKFALSSLLGFVEWASGTSDSLASYADDAYRFILAYYDAISGSTPHLYVSALAFAPKKSEVAQRMRPFFPNLLIAGTNPDTRWSPWLRNIPHSMAVTSVGISSDGRRIISGCEDNTVQIWDAETGIAISDPLKGHSDRVTTIAFSPSGRRIVSGSYDHTVRIWDPETGANTFVLQHLGDLFSVVFSPDERHVLTGSFEGMLQVWDVETGDAVTEPLAGHSAQINAIVFTPDTSRFVTASGDHTIQFWDAKNNTKLSEPLVAHSDFVYAVAFSPDGHRMVSGSNDKTIYVWDVERRAKVLDLQDGDYGPVRSIAFSPDGHLIIAGCWDKTIRIWDANTGAVASEPFTGHQGSVRSVVFTPDCRRIVSGSEDGTVRVWDMKARAAVSEHQVQEPAYVRSVAFSPDSRRIVSGYSDCTVRIWDVETGAAISEPLMGHTSYVWSVAWSPDGRRLASGAWDNTVRIWDAETGNAASEPLLGHSDAVYFVTFSPDSRRIASSSCDGTVRVWDANTGAAILGPLVGHLSLVQCVKFSPDGRHIASCGHDKMIRIWDAETGSPVLEPFIGNTRPVRSIAYSPDGKRIVSGAEDNTMRIWNAETGVEIFDEPLMGRSGVVYSVDFSPDGKRVVAGAYDNTVQIWDAKEGLLVSEPLRGHSDFIRSVVWSPNGKRIASAPNDVTIRIWDAEIQMHWLRSELPRLPPSTSQLTRLIDEKGWVRMSQGELLLWLPTEHRRLDDSLLQISVTEVPNDYVLDSSRFVHGDSWKSVTG